MNGCGRVNVASDANDMKDAHAERMVLCGCLHLGTPFLDRLDAAGFTRSDFF